MLDEDYQKMLWRNAFTNSLIDQGAYELFKLSGGANV